MNNNANLNSTSRNVMPGERIIIDAPGHEYNGQRGQYLGTDWEKRTSMIHIDGYTDFPQHVPTSALRHVPTFGN